MPSPTDARAALIVLGAGAPYQGAELPALRQVQGGISALQWCLQAFSALAPDVHFVGGYQLDRIRARFPHLHYSVNLDWKRTGATASLLQAPLDSAGSVFVCYGDIVFTEDVVAQIAKSSADICIAVDTSFLGRKSSVRLGNPGSLEKVQLQGAVVTGVGQSVSMADANGIFVGLARLLPGAVECTRALRALTGEAHLHWPISRLLQHLASQGLRIEAVDVAGRWATFDEPQDVARLVFGTKAETLERLRPVVRKCRILDQVVVRSDAWMANSQAEIDRILAGLGEVVLIVRSSAQNEDGWTESNAGHFRSVLNVAPHAESIRQAVEEVFTAYGVGWPPSQVLVQPMLHDVVASGVVLTRTLRQGAPYYVVNFQEGADTEAVTSGAGRQVKTLVAHHSIETGHALAAPLQGLLPAIRELEGLVGYRSLDIEFAIGADATVYALQLRPIVTHFDRWRADDGEVHGALSLLQDRLRAVQVPPGQGGQQFAFGVMPDWNPAEIVGVRPRALAISLYQHLITNDVWAQQRAEIGYRDVRSWPLVHMLAGHAFVDVRASLNSFVPSGLSTALGDRLVDFYLSKLRKNPAFHDKIEFEIAITCLSFSFAERSRELLCAGFTEAEIGQLREALRNVTVRGVAEIDGHIANVHTVVARQARAASVSDPLQRARLLIEDCRRFGTIAFAHLARQGFVAMDMLRSAVDAQLLPQADYDSFMRSLHTVSSRFAQDCAALGRGAMSAETFLDNYGHLRPGTYDLTLPCYAKDPELLAEWSRMEAREPEVFAWSPASLEAFRVGFEKLGLPEVAPSFDRFARTAIEGREWSKLQFTRSVSMALEAVADFGATQGLSREQLSHVSWPQLEGIALGLAGSDVGAYLLRCAQEGEAAHRCAQATELPDLIFSPEDIWLFQRTEDRANFVGRGRAVAPMVDLSEENDPFHHDVAGKIVLIQQADPGYDWLFARKIAGIITVRGGPNSHMAIRAAEFDLPSAIGIGTVAYEKIRSARRILIDCASHQLSIVA